MYISVMPTTFILLTDDTGRLLFDFLASLDFLICQNIINKDMSFKKHIHFSISKNVILNIRDWSDELDFAS